MNGHSGLLVLICIALLQTGGCATVDFDHPKQVTYALTDTEDTYLGSTVSKIVAGKPPDQSGFVALEDGIEALAMRLLMAERAEKTIDAQYYLLKNDVVGNAFLRALLSAADRGVRVRLLLDDMFTSGYDTGMAALDSHPNFEIRIFNPFASRTMRAWDGITSFTRINRRMHNKSFTVDNLVTLIGGRNIADEYFGAREDAKFGDLDVAAVGPVVQEVSDTFDSYWNHERAAPIAAFAKLPDDPEAELVRLRQVLEKRREEITTTRYAAAVRDLILDYIEDDSEDLIWAPYILTVDSPDKSIRKKAAGASSIVTPLAASLNSAKKEMVIVSPYFVPGKAMKNALIKRAADGTEVIVITNSLASNNQLVVHSGYGPSRKPLLRGNVKIYETREDADVKGSELVASSGAKATLHTKAFVVDREQVFIGSFNFDPRSAFINTELGVIIHSSRLAADLLEPLDEGAGRNAYEVFLKDGKLRWRAYHDEEEVVYTKEPSTTWMQRFSVGFLRLLPIKGQL
jgi:putative cardiolipin synthase